VTFFEKYIYKGGPKKLMKRIGMIFIALLVALLLKSWSLAKESSSATSSAANEGNEFDRQVLIITLKETERQITQNLPQRLDDITVLNHIAADQTTLRYFYKVDGVYDSAEWSYLMESELVSFVCNNPGMKAILDQGGSYEFNYVDKNDDTLASIELPLSKCS
jgi:hypothetical protein